MKMNSKARFNSVDLFSGAGGLTLGMKKAGFQTKVAIEINESAVKTFRLNHKKTTVITEDIREVSSDDIASHFNGEPLHFLAGCPPCQGFSSIRRLNKRNVRDKRNSLVLEYLRIVKELRPLTIMMENVPNIENYFLFRRLISELKEAGYHVDYKVVNIKDYGVPQSRKRLVLVGSLLGEIKVATGLRVNPETVRKFIAKLPKPADSEDWLHKIVATHSPEVQERIRLTPKNGGSRKDLPKKYTLECHKPENNGFNDIYGRLRWDDVSSTITGGCLNPSKGRFLHPEQDRCISAREASILQSFPLNYKFARETSKTDLALMIGNALPPRFSFYQSQNVYRHLQEHLANQ